MTPSAITRSHSTVAASTGESQPSASSRPAALDITPNSRADRGLPPTNQREFQSLMQGLLMTERELRCVALDAICNANNATSLLGTTVRVPPFYADVKVSRAIT